jgi:hypothetical protein
MDNSKYTGTSGAVITITIDKNSSSVAKLSQLGNLIKELTGKDPIIKINNSY